MGNEESRLAKERYDQGEVNPIAERRGREGRRKVKKRNGMREGQNGEGGEEEEKGESQEEKSVNDKSGSSLGRTPAVGISSKD